MNVRCAARIALTLVVAVLAMASGSTLAQQDYPNKPIRFIVAFAPGGSSSILARLIGQKLGESLGQQVLVDNRGGGNGIIGIEALVKSPADGYTILLTGTSHVMSPSLIPNFPFDTIRDFAAVAAVSSTEYLLVLHPAVPASNLREFIALAKSRPGQLNYASSGNGSTTHLPGELFNIVAGVKMQHVPYKGGGQAIADLLGGQVQLLFAVPITVISHVKSGRLKAIAVSGEARMAALAQIPAFAEAGLAGFDVRTWFGVVAPAGTPKEIVDRLAREIAKIAGLPEVKEQLASQGMDPFTLNPEQFAALRKADLVKYANIIKAANIKLDN